jgi:hypothetical protein
MNIEQQLRLLLSKELTVNLPTNENASVSFYEQLISILRELQFNNELSVDHDLVFASLSRVILTPMNQHCSDDQLRVLLELASNSRRLSMSQNQTIDGWYRSIDTRTFDVSNENDDDDDWLDESSESETSTITKQQTNNRTSSRKRDKAEKTKTNVSSCSIGKTKRMTKIDASQFSM